MELFCHLRASWYSDGFCKGFFPSLFVTWVLLTVMQVHTCVLLLLQTALWNSNSPISKPPQLKQITKTFSKHFLFPQHKATSTNTKLCTPVIWGKYWSELSVHHCMSFALPSASAILDEFLSAPVRAHECSFFCDEYAYSIPHPYTTLVP